MKFVKGIITTALKGIAFCDETIGKNAIVVAKFVKHILAKSSPGTFAGLLYAL